MSEPPRKKARTEKTTVHMCYDPQEGEDDPGDWDDVDEDSWSAGSWSMDFDKISMGTDPTLNVPKQKNKMSVHNPPLYHMQFKMDRLRAAMNLARLSVKPDIWSLCSSNDSKILGTVFGSRDRLHTKLTQLFGPLQLKPPLTPPSIMIRQGNTTTRYIREFKRDDVLELNGNYVFRRNPIPSIKTESNFCLDLARSLAAGSALSHRATLTEGNEVATLPDLLEQITNQRDHNMVILPTCKEQGNTVQGFLTFFFERRALFLESTVRQCFDVTPLNTQPVTVELILEFVDLYKLRQWSRAETASRLRLVEKPKEDATAKKWKLWKLSKEGVKAKQMLQNSFLGTPMCRKPVVDALFDYSCEDLCKLVRRYPYPYHHAVFGLVEDWLFNVKVP